MSKLQMNIENVYCENCRLNNQSQFCVKLSCCIGMYCLNCVWEDENGQIFVANSMLESVLDTANTDILREHYAFILVKNELVEYFMDKEK